MGLVNTDGTINAERVRSLQSKLDSKRLNPVERYQLHSAIQRVSLLGETKDGKKTIFPILNGGGDTHSYACTL